MRKRSLVGNVLTGVGFTGALTLGAAACSGGNTIASAKKSSSTICEAVVDDSTIRIPLTANQIAELTRKNPMPIQQVAPNSAKDFRTIASGTNRYNMIDVETLFQNTDNTVDDSHIFDQAINVENAITESLPKFSTDLEGIDQLSVAPIERPTASNPMVVYIGHQLCWQISS